MYLVDGIRTAIVRMTNVSLLSLFGDGANELTVGNVLELS